MAATILCADVDRQLYKILEKAFGDEGYRAVPAHDGEQALEAVVAESPDIVVLDITMPKRDGFDVLETIRGLDGPASEVPVLLTSSSRITPQYEERANELGAQALLAKPVPLADLLAKVKEHVKGTTPLSRRVRGKREGVRVEGDLAEVEFPGLLHHLHGLRATGVLMISSGKKKKAIQLRDGYPVAVKSNLVHECLGNYLVSTGKLSAEAVKESLARMEEGEGLQGQILVAMDVITEDEITASLREQAEGKLYEIFEWKRGSFKLEIGSRLKRGNTLALDTSPANVILEGVRQHSPRARIDTFLARHGHREVGRSQSPFYRFQEVDLSPPEQALIEGLDGSRTLTEIVGDDDAMQRTFFGLAAAELLELGGEAVDVAPSTSPTKSEAPDRTSSSRRSANAPEEDRQTRAELAALADGLRGKNYWEMLAVSENASEAQIDAAYEKLAKQAHPDRHNNASEALRQLADEVFQLLTRAHDTLLDPKRRRIYQAERKQGERSAAEQAKNQRAVQAEVEFQHGESLLRQRDYERALAHFSRARDAAPKEGEYLAHYAWCFYLCNPDNATVVNEALAHLKRSIKMARDQEKPYLFLGRLCKVVGDGEGAQQMFTRAVQIRPDCVEAMRELRLINMRKDKGRGLIGRLLRR
jgi:CheY-like chemotaxis protein/tetratricopeptide (TPR) repeat protein